MRMPLGRLEYLYMGSSDVGRDLAYHRDVLGADVVWDFTAFGTRVAAVRLWEQGPMLLLAGHRPAGTMLPVFAVKSLDETEPRLRARGWEPKGERFGIPDGDARLFEDPSGNEFAIYEDTRPHKLEQ